MQNMSNWLLQQILILMIHNSQQTVFIIHCSIGDWWLAKTNHNNNNIYSFDQSQLSFLDSDQSQLSIISMTNHNSVLFSVHLALAGGQLGLGLPHPQVHLPPQQHLLLLLGLPDSPDCVWEIPGSVSSHHLQRHVHLKLKQTKVNLLRTFDKRRINSFLNLVNVFNNIFRNMIN